MNGPVQKLPVLIKSMAYKKKKFAHKNRVEMFISKICFNNSNFGQF